MNDYTALHDVIGAIKVIVIIYVMAELIARIL